MNANQLLLPAVAVLLLGAAVPAPAAELTKAQTAFFESKVRPILAQNCYKCHSAQEGKAKGGLQLDTREALLKGGKAGPAITPGNPEQSLLLKAISYKDEDLQMPPKGEKLSDAQIADLTAWVKMGAPDPRTGPAATVSASREIKDSERAHWSFQPVKKPAVPEVKDKNWAGSPVDAFILAKLEAKGLKPSAAADKRTLIRRASFDLIGLPPTTREVEDFLGDTSPGAFAKVVDRLLASPQYGERWGRHWLDTARYSDTKGEVKRNIEDPRNPFAWTYRDYVIKSFNDDKPYDRFIVEQIAADKLPPTADKSSLAALGFLTLGDHFMNNANDVINDRIDVVTKGFLGITVTCARCHDHKFDPIPTRDYYSLHGIFASSLEPTERPVIVKPKDNVAYLDYVKQITPLQKELDALEVRFRAAQKNKDPKLRQELAKNRKEFQRQHLELTGKIADLESTHPGAPARAMALEDKPRPADSPIFIRGEAENKGPVAPRQFLEILSGPNRQPFRFGSGRLELGQAIASRSNPLTARVMVNRIWQHHFGEGFVTTPDDLGNQSAPPSHPELIDWLAARFMDDGWSVKKMHRLIMLSNVYQQSSENNPRYAQTDPDNRLLWRANIRRLDFEAMRDSILAIGGKLDTTSGGRPVSLTKYPYSTRRSVYGYVDRQNLPEVFNHFDFANPDITTGKRYETITPQQSLFFMNSPLVLEMARELVQRVDFRLQKNEEARIRLLYEVVLQRLPRPEEIKLAKEFIAIQPSQEQPSLAEITPEPKRRDKLQPVAQVNGKKGPKAPDKVILPANERRPNTAWEEYAQALILTNEASFIN